MLSDEQLDQLEVAMLTSKLQDIPTMLTQYLPVLFSELRVTRTALNEMLEERLDAISGRASGGSGGVPVGPVNQPVPVEVQQVERNAGEDVPDEQREDTPSVQSSTNTRAKRSRKRSRKNTAAVVSGSDKPEVGGEVRTGTEGGDEGFITEVLKEL